MERRKRKKKNEFQWKKYALIVGAFVLAIVAIAIYLLPVVAYYQIETGIAARDASKLSSLMNIDELRKNLKTQKGQRIIKGYKKEKGEEPSDRSLTDLSIQWTALAASSEEEIEKAISTEGFYVALSGARAWNQEKPYAEPIEISYGKVKKMIAACSFRYNSHSEFVVRIKDEKNRYVEYFSFVFTRDGLNWRLTNVVLPLF